MDEAPVPSGGMPYGHIEQLLKETLELSKDNNRRLKRMERNALIGAILKIVIWLLVLGVPIFFLSQYLTPLMQEFQGASGGHVPSGIFGLPSAEQLKQILDTYNPKGQP